MKKIIQSLAVLTFAFTLSMCNKVNHAEISENETHQAHDHSTKSGACAKLNGDSLKYISRTIEVAGEVYTPISLTVDSLKKMKVTTIENFKVICQSGAEKKENKTCKGVLLRDILEKAKIKKTDHKDRNFYIVARATDNYKATFSWAEIFNNPTGDNVYVIFEENGKPIDSQGEMILISKNDIKTGPRHVYWLNKIEVYRVD